MSVMDTARGAVGLSEGESSALNDYLSNGGQNLDPLTTAWCAAFVNSTLNQSGMQGTNKLNARSYLDWGQPVDTPQPGDVAVFSRGDPNGWQGHVGFYEGTNPDGTINVLGGNQSDSVSVASYSPDRLLGYRRPGDTQTTPEQHPGNTLAAPLQPDARNRLAMQMRPRAVQLDVRDFL